MSLVQHGSRIGLLMVAVTGLLFWLSGHTEILFADGLRYIDQARQIDQGAWRAGLLGAVDHPVYPLAIAAAHHLTGGQSPDAWQRAAQAAAIIAGILLVVPVYLIALELFGPASAWLCTLLVYAVPLTGHVFADTLSESTFLLFWSWGLWCALRFLRAGVFRWLPLTIAFSALAYLTRPEGLLLPAALVAALLLTPLLHSTRLYWPRWWAAIAFLLIGPALLIGPYVAVKGGLGTKPAIARLLGTAPKSGAHAVERQRPLDPNQSTARTYAIAVKAMGSAVRDAVTVPLLPLVLVGIFFTWPPGERSRLWLLIAIIAVAAALALVRLHATGGYCDKRHAIVLAFLMIPMAAFGLHRGLSTLAIPAHWLGQGEGRFRPGPAVWGLVLLGLGAHYAPKTLSPVNEGFGAYRLAGQWVGQNVPPANAVVDVTGWALYYGQRAGYTFANLHEAPGDPNARWVVAREAHIRGPWAYCDQLRTLVGGRQPVASFPANPERGQAVVYVFDRQAPPSQAAMGTSETPRR